SWVYLPSNGWAWQPGGSWAGWNQPRIMHPPTHYVLPQPPTGAGQGVVVVNRGPMTLPMGKSSNKMEISNNSAGLGIPRGGVRNLGQLSHTVEQNGFATARVHTAPIGVPWSHSGYSSPGMQAGAMHGGMTHTTTSVHSSAVHTSVHR